jgi:hypothetical protein
MNLRDSDKVYKRGNKIINETVTVRNARCANIDCKKHIKLGSQAIAIIRPNKTVRLRFCSENCRNNSELAYVKACNS